MAGKLEEAPKIGSEVVTASAPDSTLENFLESLGARIRATRGRKSMTQQQLAQKAKLDRSYIVAVERGRQNVTVGAVMRIAEALDVSTDQLLVSGKMSEEGSKGST